MLEKTEKMVLTSVGLVPMPCEIRRANYLAALFKTSATGLGPLLAHTGHKPALKLGSDYYIAIGFVQYTETDLGAYNEIIISVPCISNTTKISPNLWLNLLSSLPQRKVLQYVTQIYVTSYFSMTAGREIWGYPKELLTIEAKSGKSDFMYEAKDSENNLVCKISGHMGLGVPVKCPDILTLTTKGGTKWATPVNVDCKSNLYYKPALKLEVGSSNHALGSILNELNLQHTSPLLAFYAPVFKGKFCAGYPIE